MRRGLRPLVFGGVTVVGLLGASIVAAASLIDLLPSHPCDSGCWTNGGWQRAMGVLGLIVAVALVTVPTAVTVLIVRCRVNLRQAVVALTIVAGATVVWWSVASLALRGRR